jgi:hypothetical protein
MAARPTEKPRVADTLSLMYAPHEDAQRPCHRVLPVACPDFLTVADVKGNVRTSRRGVSSYLRSSQGATSCTILT